MILSSLIIIVITQSEASHSQKPILDIYIAPGHMAHQYFPDLSSDSLHVRPA
jgi:hypothetical protein